MKANLITLGALLIAAPLFCQAPQWLDPRVAEGGGVVWFHLLETESEVRARLGQPAMMTEFGAYRSWQYRFGEGLDHDEFSHALVFRRSDGKLVSISRTYAPERNVDELFPAGETAVHSVRQTGQAEFSVRARKMTGGGMLLAMGTSRAGQTTHQIVLMHESVLPQFYPWIGFARR